MKSLLLALLLLPAVALAQPKPEAPSNFPDPYPADKCIKPYKPSNFKSKDDQEDFDNDADKYLDCVKAYVEAANNDIATIRRKATRAINRAKEPY